MTLRGTILSAIHRAIPEASPESTTCSDHPRKKSHGFNIQFVHMPSMSMLFTSLRPTLGTDGQIEDVVLVETSPTRSELGIHCQCGGPQDYSKEEEEDLGTMFLVCTTDIGFVWM